MSLRLGKGKALKAHGAFIHYIPHAMRAPPRHPTGFYLNPANSGPAICKEAIFSP